MPSLPTPPSFPGLLILFPLFLPALSSSLWRLPSSSVYISSFLKFLNIRSIGSRSLGKNRVGRHEMSTTVGTAVSPSPSTLPPSRLPSPVLCPARRSRSSSRPQDPSVVSDKIYPYFIARPMPMLARPRSLPLPLSLSPSLSLSLSPLPLCLPPLPPSSLLPVRLRINYSISVCRCAPVSAVSLATLVGRAAARLHHVAS